MGMSTHVVGFVPPDAKWKKMKAAFDACATAGIPQPKEVEKFFQGEEPDDSGVSIEEGDLRKAGAIVDYEDDSRSGFEVIIEKLPQHVKTIRFFNSW